MQMKRLCFSGRYEAAVASDSGPTDLWVEGTPVPRANLTVGMNGAKEGELDDSKPSEEVASADGQGEPYVLSWNRLLEAFDSSDEE